MSNYITIGSFDWVQELDHFKIWIDLEGINEDKIEADFKPKSADIKFHDVQGKNYWVTVPNLYEEIVPHKCRLILQPLLKRVIVILVKASKGYWFKLQFKKFKPNIIKEQDQMSRITDFMKNMHVEGDGEMIEN